MPMNIPAIEAHGLQKKYKHVLAVRGLELKVERGEIFGLVGADGAGKTTIMQMLCTLSLPSAGEARILGMDTVKQAGSIKEKIGYMSERFNLYPTLTVEENLDFFARLRNIPREVSKQRKKELLSFCRLEPFRKRQAEHLSGGMQKKLALACSLIHEPEVVFLDEPTTGVDPVSRRDFWRIITGFLSKGITVLVSTPYLDEAERFNRVALIHQGQIIACDTPQNLKNELAGEILEIRANPVRQAVATLRQSPFSSTPQLFGDTIHIMVDKAEERRSEVRHLLEQENITVQNIVPIPPSLEDAFVTRLAGLEEKPSSQIALNNLAGALLKKDERSEIAIKVSDLTRKFGDFTAVEQVSFAVKQGEIFGLLGPNGSGKTTTIRMITGLLAPTSGSAHILGHNMATEAGASRSKMGYMSQKFSLFADLTVEENINFYGGLYGLPALQLAEGKKWVLEMAGLRGKEKLTPLELSGGWKQRLALGCTIIHSPEVVFLDEPTAGVDPLSRRSFWELIQELAARGTTIFVTTHYMDEAEHCHRLGLLYQGKLVALGSPQQLKAEQVKGELIEVVSSDYARTLELLSTDTSYHQVSLFGSAIHVVVDDVKTAYPKIKGLLESGNITVYSISRIPFTLEDVFISLVEEYEEKGA
ncbi:MAG: transporter [Dehalococcoidales bacterium]|nr:transporter [Dehalococcoidales bacterium]